jgi:hypothetical protein
MRTGYCLRYRSTRREVWQWYWRAWRQRLWRTHVLLVWTVATATLLRTGLSARHVALGLALGVLAVAWLPLVPVIAFKSNERTLRVDERGIDTSIGRLSATRAWGDVAAIDEQAGTIVIALKNGNAFIVPARAFGSDEERATFFEAASAWRRAAQKPQTTG